MYALYIILFYFLNVVACQHGNGHSKNLYDKCEYKVEICFGRVNENNFQSLKY